MTEGEVNRNDTPKLEKQQKEESTKERRKEESTLRFLSV